MTIRTGGRSEWREGRKEGRKCRKGERYPYVDVTPLVGARDSGIQNLFAKLSLIALFH